jgi:Mg2+-importing ATPase
MSEGATRTGILKQGWARLLPRALTPIHRGRIAPGSVEERFWMRPAADLMAALGTSIEGLGESEAARRLAASGPNAVGEDTPRRIGARVLAQLADPLIAILLVAAAVSGLTGDRASFFIILTVVLVSLGLDVVQEHRAERAAEALKRAISVRNNVRRAGALRPVRIEEIVPGDVVALAAGDLVPADGIVLGSRGAHANESLLTGEPYPVEKRVGPSGADDPADAYDALFGGTALVSGEATMLVVETGARTRFGGIAAALEAAEPPTAFERGLHALGLLVLRLTIFLVLLVLLAHLAFHRPPLESFMFAVALAVGLTPELLPMVTTVTLSRGAVRMSRRRVIVKRLAAIHDLGAMDVLCTDKTGTLTEARIALAGHPGIDGADLERVVELAAVNSRFETGVRSPLDDAILAHAEARDLAAWRKIDDVPFDFERRRVSVLAEHEGRRLVIVKGAPEEILRLSVSAETRDGRVVPCDAELRVRLEAMEQAKAAEGLRLIGVAWRAVDAGRNKLVAEDERDLVFAGFCAFVDPPKASAAEAVRRLKGQGVRVKVVSGDGAPVVRHLVESLGVEARGLLTGAEIAALGDEALAARVDEVDLFARVSPDQKTRIIRALQARGHTVGFIGDGINDAPAIKAADAGISVEGATDVARAAADLILLAPDLGVLADGVDEGRRTYANIMKYIRMGTSSNFGNMLSMALASLAIPFLPLTAVQILLNNLLYDLSEIGIPFDQVDGEDLAAPHGWDMRQVLRFTLTMGPLSSVFDIATFGLLLWVFEADPATFRTAWFVESITTQVLVIFLIRTARPPWRSLPHPFLALSSLGALAAALLVALGPFAGTFGFVPLPAALLGSIAGLVLGYLVLAELLKRSALAGRLAPGHPPAAH